MRFQEEKKINVYGLTQCNQVNLKNPKETYSPRHQEKRNMV